MRKWENDIIVVVEVAFDGDLHALEVFDLVGRKLGDIVAPDVDAFNELTIALDMGECPIAQGWEDGNGNTCTLEGWE